MSALFSSPDIPDPIVPPPVPTVDEAAQRQQSADRIRKRKGRAATVLTSDQGTSATTGAPTLLGS